MKPKPQNSGCAIRKLTELEIAMNEGRFRQETARSADARDVGGGQMRIHHVHLQIFNPAVPASGDKMDGKRRFSPSLCTVARWLVKRR